MVTKNKDANAQLIDKAEGNGESFGSIVNACFGLSGEVYDKEVVFHGKTLDDTHAKKSWVTYCGMLLWYVMVSDGI